MGEGCVSSVLSSDATYCILEGDCVQKCREIPDNSVDSMVTDPPSAISFMNMKWDSDHGGEFRWMRWLCKAMKQAYRVLKPGGYCVVWSLPRTSYLTGCALKLAGFEIRDTIDHMFGSGFPKSLNVSLAIDKEDGVLDQRDIIHQYTASGNAGTSTADKGGTYSVGTENSPPVALAITRGATEKSRKWDGFGTGLKPAKEVWWIARKPMNGRLIDNVLQHGTGAINIDGCRVATDWNEPDRPDSWKQSGHTDKPNAEKIAAPPGDGIQCHPAGRWPANVVFSHDARCKVVSGDIDIRHQSIGTPGVPSAVAVYGDGLNGKSCINVARPIPKYHCVDGCPVKLLDGQSGESSCSLGGYNLSGSPNDNPTRIANNIASGQHFGDSGTASRFFNQFEWHAELDDPFVYMAKPSTVEREVGCEKLPRRSAGELTGGREEDSAGLDNPRAGAGRSSRGRHNHHPTLKSIALMMHLQKLVTPPGGVTLSMFLGSGTDGVAALLGGFRFIGIEKEPDYVAIARARIEYWAERGKPTKPKIVPRDERQLTMFGSTP